MAELSPGRPTRALRELRAERLLAIRDLARMAGVSPEAVQALESGRSSVTPDVARAIASALGVEPSVIAELRPPPESGIPSGAPRILVVEDEPRLRALVGRILDSTGYSVSMAANGAEALAALPVWQPDVILLDLNMPVMDGRTFCCEVAREPAFADIPIVVVSSDATSEAACAPCRPAAYLLKPFNPAALLETIETILIAARASI